MHMLKGRRGKKIKILYVLLERQFYVWVIERQFSKNTHIFSINEHVYVTCVIFRKFWIIILEKYMHI